MASSQGFGKPLRIEFRQSRLCRAVFALLHLLGCVAVLIAHLPLAVKLLLMAALIASLVRAVWLLPGERHGIAELRLHNRELQIRRTGSEHLVPATRLPGGFVSARLVVERIRIGRARLLLLVCRWNVAETRADDAFRRLRVFLSH